MQRRDGVALAVDFGGTKVEAAIVDNQGHLIQGTRFRASTGPAASSNALTAAVLKVVGSALRAAPPAHKVIGAGIGAAGPIHIERGTVSPLNLPAWHDYPLLNLVRRAVGWLPTRMRLDGQCIAIAEHWVGAARGFDDVLGVTISTGIGGGLVLGGQAIVGGSGNAGHFGHIEVGGFDDKCVCGGIGCIEAIASGPRTVGWARTQGWTGATGEDLAVSYTARDTVALAAVQRAGIAIGRAIAGASCLADVQLVAIGGGFSRVTPDLVEFIREGLSNRTTLSFVSSVNVIASTLSDEGPLIGAGALVHQFA